VGRSRAAQAWVDSPETDPVAGSDTRSVRTRHRASRWRMSLQTVFRMSLWLLAGLALGLVVLALQRFLLEEPRFRLPASEWEAEGRALVIEGLRCTPRSEVLAVFRPDLGGSIYQVPLGERRRQLRAIDWVADATVLRRWPNRLEIHIRERQPVAFVIPGGGESRRSGATAMVDADGVWLRWPAQGRFTLPVLWGVDAEQTQAVRRSRVRFMLHLFDQLQMQAGQVSEVDLSNPDNVVVTLVFEGRALRLMLGRENFRARLKAFRDYYPQIARWAPEARSFDLRVDGQVRVADPVVSPAATPVVGVKLKGEERGR